MSKAKLKNWHKAVCERDNYTCHVCKKWFHFPVYFNDAGVNQYVCGHHVKSQKAHPDLKYDVDNGVCICFHCHEKVHRGKIKI